MQRCELASSQFALEVRSTRRQDRLEELTRTAYQNHEGISDHSVKGGLTLEGLLDDVVRNYVGRALEETGGNKTSAGELVGLGSYQTLTNWMEQLVP